MKKVTQFGQNNDLVYHRIYIGYDHRLFGHWISGCKWYNWYRTFDGKHIALLDARKNLE